MDFRNYGVAHLIIKLQKYNKKIKDKLLPDFLDEKSKNFIKERANQKLIELGYGPTYNDIDPALLKQIEWFGHLTSGVEHQDFFALRPSSYSKSTADWSDL